MIIGATFMPSGNCYIADRLMNDDSSFWKYDTFHLLENIWSDDTTLNNEAKMFDAVFKTHTAKSLKELIGDPE